MKKTFSIILGLFVVYMAFSPGLVSAVEAEEVTEVTATEVGVSATAANTAIAEATTLVNEAGTLIEIGNTTAEETTIIIRVTRGEETVDQTVQINSSTKVLTNAGRSADLSDWIAGDYIGYTAQKGENSGELVATVLRNRSFKRQHFGRNGWIKDIRVSENKMDVEWAGKIYTLNTDGAKMVAGLKNPASLEDFKIGDRVRARVSADGDNNQLTWNAEIIVVLRRGQDLFMRVTRWVVPAEITSIPEDMTIPYVITAKVLPSKFYEAGDVNNLVGAPDTEISIQVNENTKLVRRFLGKAMIGEFSEGDKIRVVGRLNDGTGNLDAVVIKNNSIQRLGVSSRISEVKSVDTVANTMVVQSIGIKNPLTGKRFRISGQEWTVALDERTKIKEQGKDISLADVKSGDIVRVRGTVNRPKKTVNANAIAVVTKSYNKYLKHL